MPGNHHFRLAVHELEQNPPPGWRRRTIHRDYNPPGPRSPQLFDEWNNLARQVGDVVHQSDRTSRWVHFKPITIDDAGICDPRVGGIGPETGAHGGRGLDVADLTAT